MPQSILIVDDHQLIIDGLSAIISEQEDFELAATAHDGKRAVQLVETLKPDIVLMDIDMPIMNGLEATQIIKRDFTPTKVMILTMHSEPSLIKKVIEIGADGYLLKDSDREEFTAALKMIVQGKSYFGSGVTEALLGKEEKTSSFSIDQDTLLLSKMTSREVEILRLIAEGYSNKEIGDQLFISHRTVDTHRTNLMKKLDVHNIAGLIRFAMKNGMLS